MDYRFSLTDRKTGEKKVISEPVKFDGFVPIIKRGSYHGITPDQSDTEIEFDRDAGYILLKSLFEKYGVDAEIDFLCEYSCGGSVWEEYYSGQIDFATLFEERFRNWCRIASCIMANDIRITFLEKRDDEVDLDSLVSRSGKELTKYENLGREIMLPPKAIKTISETVQKTLDGVAQFQEITVYRSGNYFEDDAGYCGAGSGTYPVDCCVPYKSILHFRLNEKTYEENCFVHNGLSESLPAGDTKIVSIMTPNDAGIGFSDIKLEINISGQLIWTTSAFYRYTYFASISNIRVIIGGSQFDIEGSFSNRCDGILGFSFSKIIQLTEIADIEIVAEINSRISWIHTDYPYTSTNTDILFAIDDGSYVRLTANSQYSATPAKTYMIHESLARIAENLTDGQLTVKSDFYGRTDSEVHPTTVDGNGGLRALSNGYLIRRAKMTDGTIPKIFASWKKLFESLQAIDNVGFGFEAGGIIRVEPMEYFYKDDVIMTCEGVNEHTIKFDTESNIRTVKTGYKKWLSDEYNSIDGFHTTREYHTPVEKSKVAKEYLSDLIADGYAIEATRRRQIEDPSKDWQYDNDLFILDLKRMSEDIRVNAGASDTGGTLIDPVTIYNARLSPARMAMRHFSDMTRAIPPAYVRALKFSASEGYATAKMRAEGNYVIEKNTIVENQDMTVDDFADADELLLDVSPNLITFKYPIKPYEFRHIREHPYGLVDADGILGWVKELEWETGKEIANFTLIIKK
jgi:hypothetical protein